MISFHLQRKCFLDSTRYMISFHIEMLFTNIPLEATINICDDELFENKTNKVNNLTK